MRLSELAVGYAVVGLACAATVVRRRPSGDRTRERMLDAWLTALLWPLYLPMLWSAPMETRRVGTEDPHAPSAPDEHARLLAAFDAIGPSTLARVLPSRAQLVRLGEHLAGLDARVRDLDAACTRARDEAPRDASEHAAAVRASLERLELLRRTAAAERDELRGLCARLQADLTVLRFADTGRDDAREILGDLLARVEGVGAALGAYVAPPQSHRGEAYTAGTVGEIGTA